MTNALIFHHNDLDGYVSAAGILAHCLNSDIKIKDKMVVCDYNNTTPTYEAVNAWINDTKESLNMEDKVYNKVYLVDLSLNDEMVKQVVHMLDDDRISNVTIIDHHQSGYECWLRNGMELTKYVDLGKLKVYIDVYKCAAMNVARYYHIPVRLFLVWVDDYDRWIHDHEESMYINYAFYSMLESADIYINLVNCINADADTINNMLATGKSISAYKKATNKQWEPFIYTREFEGLNVAVLNYKLTNSSVFPDEIYKNYDAVITWGYNGTRYLYSIYTSNDNVNCAAIAVKYGGGGHKGAAGFSSDKFILE